MFLLLAILLISDALSGVILAQTTPPIEISPLFGQVQTVSTVTTIAGRVGERVVSSYDLQGHETETVRYSSEGVLLERVLHTYNAKGQRIETLIKNATGDVQTRTLYLYDLQGRRSEKTTLDSIGILDKTTYTHDPHKKSVDETTTYTHRAVTQRVIRFFDANGREVQTFAFERDGAVTKTTFAYDATGTMIERKQYASDELLLDHLRYTHTFDASRNWITQTELLCSSANESPAETCTPTAVIVRSITYAGRKQDEPR